MDAHKPVTLEEGDRYPLGPPNDAVYGSGHPFGLISQESQVRILPPQPVLGYIQQTQKLFIGKKQSVSCYFYSEKPEQGAWA